MVFSSIPFIFMFLPVFLLLYYLVPFRFKNYILLIFSLIFYAWGEPVYILLMIGCTLVNYGAGLLIDRFRDNEKARKAVLIGAIAISIGFLGFYKYTDFLIEIINGLLKTHIPLPNIRLPIGISFFTFQALSYTIDLYKDEIKVEKNYAYFLMYVSMFPQLIAGPIVRYATVAEELRNREISKENFYNGFYRFLTGLFKKVLIANQMGKLWEFYNNVPLKSISILGGWLGLIAFTLQLYFDFSAYSDMAIGMGKMMGFNYLENFNYPLSAMSVTDFWRRWHISMSTWFRDYVYIPLGGNRVSRGKHIRNIFVVWFLTGLWHGASWNFIFWGLYYGILLILEKYLWGEELNNLPKVVRHIYSIFIIVFGFGIFAMPDFNRMCSYFGKIFDIARTPLINAQYIYYLNNFKIVLIIAMIFSFPVYPWIVEKIKSIEDEDKKKAVTIGAVAVFVILFLVSTAYLVADTYNPFLYFRF